MSVLLKSIFILFSLVSSANTQYIATSNSYDTELAYIFENFQNALSEPLLEELQKQTFEDFTKADVTVSGIRATEVSSSVDGDCYGDIKKNFYILSPDKVLISFEFNYKIGQEQAKKGYLDLQIFDLAITLEAQEKTIKPITDLAFLISGFLVYAPEKEKLQNAFFDAYALPFHKKITACITEAVKRYFMAKVSKKSPFLLELHSLFGRQKIPVNLNQFVGLCEIKDANYQTAICFYSGHGLDPVDTNLRSKIYAYEEFIKPSQYKKLFLNYKIFNAVIDQLTKEQEVIINLNSESPIAAKLPYKLNVGDLKKVVADSIVQGLADDLPFSVTSSVKEVSLKRKASSIKFLSFVIINRYQVLQFDSEFEFEVNYSTVKGTPAFNGCVSAIKILNVAFKPDTGVKDKALFSNWILKTLQAIGSNNFCLGHVINLRDYFQGEIKKFVAEENGVYLEAKSIY